MQIRSIRRSGKPISATASRMRAFDRDLIRGGHYGQRPCEPHTKAAHMALLRPDCDVQKVLANKGPFHTWHLSTLRLREMAEALRKPTKGQ
jgi:hypothetical protein